MRLIGFAGWSGAGKTTLLQCLIPVLLARGVSVSTVKHAHHAFDVDQPGKDSFLHRLHPDDPSIVAIAADPMQPAAIASVRLDDIEAVAGLVLGHAQPIGEPWR